MKRKKKVGYRDLSAMFREIADLEDALEASLARAKASCKELGFDMNLPALTPAKKRRVRRAKSKRAPKKRTNAASADQSLRTLGIRGRAIGAVIAAGYPTFARLDGASKAKLLKVKGVGKGVVDRLERELKRRGMALKP
jgi:hypothetical protein